MNRLRRAAAIENHALEFTTVAIAGFLLGNAVRAEWGLLRQTLRLLFES